MGGLKEPVILWTLGIACRPNGCGLVRARWTRSSPNVTFDAAIKTSPSPADTKDAAEQLRAKRPTIHVLIDPGPFGKGYVEELARRYKLTGELVDPGKQYEERRRAAQELMAAAMRARTVKVVDCPNLVKEWRAAVWGEGRVQQAPAELPLADASLWAWSAAYAYTYREEQKTRLSPAEAAGKVEEAMEQAALRRLAEEEGETAWLKDYQGTDPDLVRSWLG